MPLVAHPVRSLWGSQLRCARCLCEWLHRKWDGAWPERTLNEMWKSRADQRPPYDIRPGPQQSSYEDYNRRQAPTKDPTEGLGNAAAWATTARIPLAKMKGPKEFASNLPQNNATSCHPRIWLPMEAGLRPSQAERDRPQFQVHKIISMEGILTVRDLALWVEHSLHITELCKLYEPPEDLTAERHKPIELQFLEQHEQTDNEEALGYVEGDLRHAWRYDYYWVNNPKAL